MSMLIQRSTIQTVLIPVSLITITVVLVLLACLYLWFTLAGNYWETTPRPAKRSGHRRSTIRELWNWNTTNIRIKVQKVTDRKSTVERNAHCPPSNIDKQHLQVRRVYSLCNVFRSLRATYIRIRKRERE